MGFKSAVKESEGILPTKTKAVKTYIAVIKSSESIIARGKFLLGFLISPAIAATFITPE